MTILTVVTKSIYGRHSADQWSQCDGSNAISKTAQAPSSPSNFWRLIVVWLIKNDNLYKKPLVKQAIKMQKSGLLDMASQYQKFLLRQRWRDAVVHKFTVEFPAKFTTIPHRHSVFLVFLNTIIAIHRAPLWFCYQ